MLALFLFVSAMIGTVHADNIQYIYDSQNRLIEVDYSDHVVKYTYDAAGNRTATIVQLVAVLQINTVTPVAGRSFGGQQIVLAGSFANLSTVTIGGNGATWSYTNAGDTTSITINTPAHSVGAVQIDVTPASGNAYSKANAFAYLPTVFTDDTILVGQTTAKAQHIIELRQAVDALRAVAGLSAAPWNDPGLATGGPIRAIHILDLRTYLDDAATRLGYSTSPYTDAALTSGFVIKRIHVEELRQRIRVIAG
jgi:YD repeat-containing protein